MTFTAKNKLGKSVSYEPEFAMDLCKVYGLSVSDIIENIYGSEILIKKEGFDSTYNKFTLYTNDIRDEPIIWKHKVVCI